MRNPRNPKGKNQHPGTRTITKPIRLTPADLDEARRLAALYGGNVSEVLRAGIHALAREHANDGGKGA